MYNSGCSYDLDVAMAHSFNQNTSKQAALEEGFAAARKEDDQIRKLTTFRQYIKPQFHSSGFLNILELGDQKHQLFN